MEGYGFLGKDLFFFITFFLYCGNLSFKGAAPELWLFIDRLVWAFISVSLTTLGGKRNVDLVTKKNDLFYSLAIT